MRLDLGMKIEDFLDDNQARHLPSLMRAQATQSVQVLARMALQERYVARVEDALADEDELLKAFRLAVSQDLRRIKK